MESRTTKENDERDDDEHKHKDEVGVWRRLLQHENNIKF